MENIKPLDRNGVAVLWTQILLQFVRKEEGKWLSTNDLTDELLQKIQSAGTSNFDGDYNSLIGQPSINGITLEGNKTLEDLGITKAIIDAIGNVTQISFEVLESFADLPINGEAGVFYLTPNNGGGSNNYDEWIWNPKNSMYELIGSIQSDIELSNYYTKAEVDELLNKTPNIQSDCAPVGTIISYMGINAPSGYLACNGAVYNISQYPELSNHFNNNFGNAGYFGGNGTSTFAVPDLRGEFLRGTGTATRNTGSGAEIGVHQDGTKIPLAKYGSVGSGNGMLTGYNSMDNADKIFRATNTAEINYSSRNTNLSNVGEIVTRPTNTSVLYCIKYQTTFQTPQRKYLINTDALKLIADENAGVCHLDINGKAPESAGILIQVPSEYRPIYEVVTSGNQKGGAENTIANLFIKVLETGKVEAKYYLEDFVMHDLPVTSRAFGQVNWFYKQIEGND